MAYFYSLLLIAILTVASGATPLYCSDVQSPAASGSGHNTDLSQVTTLQYCIIDNCTIMRIDTGQQLDIVYTTESLLIVTPKDGHTSMAIAKINDELPCLEYHNTTDDNRHTVLPVEAMIYSLTMIVSACILIVHLLVKKPSNSLFGKLLSFYNFAMIFTSGNALTLHLFTYWIKVNSQAICHIITIILTLAITGTESFGTNILCHLAYLMYRCYHLKSEISKKRSQFLFRHYTGYAAFILILLFFVTIAYDWRTGNGKYTSSASGHCRFLHPSYNTVMFFIFIVTINKFLQITMFLVYLVYYYKFNMNVHAAQVSLRYSQKLFRIAIAMGATVGLTYFVAISGLLFPEYSDITIIISNVLSFSQQAVILASLMCTKKIFTLCKAYLSGD